jgi:hypothetical protein
MTAFLPPLSVEDGNSEQADQANHNANSYTTISIYEVGAKKSYSCKHLGLRQSP